MYRLVSLAGIGFFILTAFVFSRDRKKIPWRTVLFGVLLQVLIALFLLQSGFGRYIFKQINSLVVEILSHARAGAELIFGGLAVPPGETGSGGEKSLGFFLFFQGFPTIIFVASLMAVLYYIRIMPRIVELFSRIFSKLLKLSGAESLASVNQIFVGIETVFAIRPYLGKLTNSEMHLLLTAGMATIASSVLAFYTQIMMADIPEIGGHLVSASLLSAPAAVIMAKILYPETGSPETMGKRVQLARNLYDTEDSDPPAGVLDAAIHGATEGMKLVLGISAMLIAFLGIVSLLNAMVGWGGSRLGIGGLSFEKILGWIFYPAALLSGVKPGDVSAISELWGLRLVATEVPAYFRLADMMKEGLDPRSAVIGAYGLCGFAHVAALAIFAGGISTLVPKRRKDLAKLGVRALFAATLACFQTAAVAGLCLTAEFQPLIG